MAQWGQETGGRTLLLSFLREAKRKLRIVSETFRDRGALTPAVWVGSVAPPSALWASQQPLFS